MLISALFTGQPVKGYQTGETYRLQVLHGPVLTIKREDGSGEFSYVGFLSFLKDWDQINIIDKGVLVPTGAALFR